MLVTRRRETWQMIRYSCGEGSANTESGNGNLNNRKRNGVLSSLLNNISIMVNHTLSEIHKRKQGRILRQIVGHSHKNTVYLLNSLAILSICWLCA